MKASDYVWIMAWGRQLQSNTDYTRRVQEQAAADGAPLTATFHRDDARGWRTVEEVTNALTLHDLRCAAVDLGIADTSPIDTAEARILQLRPGWHLTEAARALQGACDAAEVVGDAATVIAARTAMEVVAAAIDVRLGGVIDA